MNDAKYNDIYVLAVDGTKEVFYDVYKAMKVETFKRVVSMQSRGKFGAWEDMTLVCLETVMEDNDQSLESYHLKNGSIIRCVLSDRAARKKVSVRKDAQMLKTEISATPPPPYESSKLTGKILQNVFARNLDTSKSENLGPIELAASIKTLRRRVATKENWPVGCVRMIFGGKELQNEHTLMNYGIQNESTIHIVSRLPGGLQH